MDKNLWGGSLKTPPPPGLDRVRGLIMSWNRYHKTDSIVPVHLGRIPFETFQEEEYLE